VEIYFFRSHVRAHANTKRHGYGKDVVPFWNCSDCDFVPNDLTVIEALEHMITHNGTGSTYSNRINAPCQTSSTESDEGRIGMYLDDCGSEVSNDSSTGISGELPINH
jgi:hypothetical protein